ncbi:MAG TPA: CehA/McbA family metallohydrolase [Thermoplasmata archaeon]|nr:CehA/McbA family metallohydrolase [Thermoplasmata archaeon]
MTNGLRLDLHVHSRHSPDSRLTLAQIIDQLGPAGLQGFALTDHNSVAGHSELARLATQYPRYRLIPGVEVSTRDGHVLGYGVAEAPPPYRPAEETIGWILAHGGVPVPAHPCRWSHGIGRRLAEQLAVPALETTNGHNPEIANARAELIAARRQIGSTGGSDVHELRDLGRAYTEFPEDVDSIPEILTAIRIGHTRGAGASLRMSARLRLAVRTSLLRATRGFRGI